MWRAGLALAGLIASGAALGQAPAAPPVAPHAVVGQAPAASQAPGMAGEVQSSYARLKTLVIKAAQGMPADNYEFKPTADVRTFARVVSHVTEAQSRICGTVCRAAQSDLVKASPENADKAAVVEALLLSFAQCDKAYAGLTDSNAEEMMQMGPTKKTRLGLLWSNVSHDSEQYATLALYMRLKGLVPPSSEK